MTILGIDPGMRGGWAAINPSPAPGTPPRVVAAGKTPARKGPGRTGHDMAQLVEILRRHAPVVAYMETPQEIRPNGEALNATATAGLRASADVWRAACDLAGVPVVEMAPGTWHSRMGVKHGRATGTKAQAAATFARLFGRDPAGIGDGAVDAALIAVYGDADARRRARDGVASA